MIWLLRAAIFFLLFAFALNNQHDVVVHWFFGARWQGSLVLAILAAFGLGVLVGMAGWLSIWRHQRREGGDTAAVQQRAVAALSDNESLESR